MILQE